MAEVTTSDFHGQVLVCLQTSLVSLLNCPSGGNQLSCLGAIKLLYGKIYMVRNWGLQRTSSTNLPSPLREPSWKRTFWLSLHMTVALPDILTLTSWEIPRQNYLSCFQIAHPEKLCEITNTYSCFKPLNFG